MTISVDVMVPTWNRLELLEVCLGSLRAQTLAHNVVVIDNGSADGTVEWVRSTHPDVRLLALPENVGFGRAINMGVDGSTADYIVVLNNDTVPEPTFLERVVEPLRQGFASTAGAVVHDDGATVDAVGIAVDRGLAGYSVLTGAPVSSLSLPLPTVLGPLGAAAAYRRDVFERLGGFDEEIFAYNEDTELALRLSAAGESCVVVPAARVLHRASSTLGKRSPRQLELAGYGRGYVMGRYRVSWRWVIFELFVGSVDVALQRNWAPLASRWRGLRRGRALPARHVDSRIASVTFLDSLRLRWRAARRPTPPQSAGPHPTQR